MLDFELGARNAYQTIFGPNVAIRHCIFHLGQSIHRHIKRNGLTPLYNNEQYKKLARSLVSLSFLPENRVNDAFHLIFNRANALNLQNGLTLFDYFGR